MTQIAKLFAIKLLIKDLYYSSTRLEPLLKEIEALIEFEKNTCTNDCEKRLQNLNLLIDSEF